ncbi:MAG: hypothetical protein R3E21_08305 [Caenibius sp.]
MDESDDWIRGKEIPPLIHKHARWIRNTGAWMQDYLFTGMLHARAARATLEGDGRFGKKEICDNYQVPSVFWEKNANSSYFDVGQEKFSNVVYALGIRKIECIGLSFKKNEFLNLAGIEQSEIDKVSHAQMKAADGNKRQNARGAGAYPKSDDWAAFAAAMAVVFDQNEIRADASDASIHDMVSDFLVERGRHCLSVDTCRPAIRMGRAWINGQTFHGDGKE